MGLLKNSELDRKQLLQSNHHHSRGGGNRGNISRLPDACFHGHDESEPFRFMMKGFFNTPDIVSAQPMRRSTPPFQTLATKEKADLSLWE